MNGPIFLYIYIYIYVTRTVHTVMLYALLILQTHCTVKCLIVHCLAVVPVSNALQRIHRHCLQQNSQEVVSRFRPGLTCLSRLCARIPARHAVRTSQGREPPSLVPRPFERGRQARAVETPGASSLLLIN